MATAQLVRCACDRCSCEFDSDKGFTYEGQLYCSEACATHNHSQPSECCQQSGCCH
ncbi:MAG: metallothionein [Cyanobacteria bacterium J06639_1]